MEYGQPDMDITRQLIPRDLAQRDCIPFAHVANCDGVKNIILSIMGDGLQRGQYNKSEVLQLMAPGWELAALKLHAGEQEFRNQMILSYDGAAVKNLPRRMGETVTVFRVRPARLSAGTSQLRPGLGLGRDCNKRSEASPQLPRACVERGSGAKPLTLRSALTVDSEPPREGSGQRQA
jgi:hypothetical protein